MIKKIINFFKGIKKNKILVSKKEIKRMYKNMSKNDLILVIQKLVHENEFLKRKK